jgi:hypothetical protein
MKKLKRSKSPLVEHGPYTIEHADIVDVNGISLASLNANPNAEPCAWDLALLNLLNVVAKRGRVLR